MIQRYQSWYEQECDSNAKMLDMIDSVPQEQRSDPQFAQAVTLVAHLAACRENWLDRMAGSGDDQVDWWPENTAVDTLRLRYALIEARWKEYLDGLSENDVTRDFEFPARDGNRYRWNIEGQIMQLVGHAFYHRGQVALLVDRLGGQTVDTDYLFWAISRNPDYGKIG